MAFGLYVTKDVVHFFELGRVRTQLTEGCTGIKCNSSQRRPQLMGDSGCDSIHGQKPVGSFASLQNGGAGKA